ncbi:hypothetical protein GCM10023322_73160 [Rugosimonospora acidiphila]|uniref:BON domain-containing protein n=1 Tax=Rugosimonospora acidiphila TaxID=556531 RepID=A0ABP9SQK6_9ACTN
MTASGDAYVEAAVQRLLTEDPDLSEQGLTLRQGEGNLLVQGEVESADRREAILRRLTEKFPDLRVQCDIGVTRTQAPVDAEEL